MINLKIDLDAKSYTDVLIALAEISNYIAHNGQSDTEIHQVNVDNSYSLELVYATKKEKSDADFLALMAKADLLSQSAKGV